MYNLVLSIVAVLAPVAAVLSALLMGFGLVTLISPEKSYRFFRTRLQGFSWIIFSCVTLPLSLILTFCSSPETKVPAHPIDAKVMACDQHVQEKLSCNNYEFKFVRPPTFFIALGAPRNMDANVAGVCSKLEGDVVLPDNPIAEGLFYGCEYNFVCEFNGSSISTKITGVGSTTATLGNVRTSCKTGKRRSFGSSIPSETFTLSEGK